SWAKAGIAAACFGLAGVNGPEDETVYANWMREMGASFRFSVVNDSELILGGGTPDGWGVALISGIGSVCLGRSHDGRTTRVVDLAVRNDPVARDIVERSARLRAVEIETVVRKLKLVAPPIALAGATMRVTLKKALLEKISIPIGPVVVVADAARGAVATAR